jgi:hypothetical protein
MMNASTRTTYRIRAVKYSLCALVGLSVGTSSGANAQEVTFSFSGNLSTAQESLGRQIDYLGLFGPAGGDLSGMPFTAAVTYNSASFSFGPGDGTCADEYVSNVTGSMNISVTINSKTLSYTGVSVPDYCEHGDSAAAYVDFLAGIPFPTILTVTSTKYINANIEYSPSGPPSLENPTNPAIGAALQLSWFFPPDTGGAGPEWLYGYAGNLNLVSPFLLGKSGKELGDLDLAKLLPKLTAPDSATALAADGASAAIVLFQVGTAADVTFTTNNGTTLLPYDPKFLTYAPQTTGGSSLIIPAAKLITIGSALYAAALIQAPPAGVTPTYSTPIVITAQQDGGQVQQAYLPLAPPPVLLVHGLWGDANSLSYIGKHLISEPPWNSNPSLVYAVAYPGDLAFDSTPTTNDFDGWVRSSLANTNSQGVVSGRVDLVAHSMGGLVARHYSSVAGYANFRNREQGAFHQIVTLNTPEQGSALAKVLVDSYRNVINPPGVISRKLIQKVCADAGTVQDCFADQGELLTPPGQPISAGAVSSLEPGSPNINGLPSPNIPNAIWNAISSTVSQSYYPQASSLLFGLNYLLVAACSGPDYCFGQNTAPDVEQILQTSDNDGIVPLSSQISGCAEPTCQIVTLKHLAHDKVDELSGISKYIFDTSNVEEDPGVNRAAACWLSTAGSSNCGGEIIQAALEEPSPDAKTDIEAPFKELPLSAPPAVELALPFGIMIKAPFDSLARLTVKQADELGHVTRPTELAVEQGSDGLIIAKIVPVLMGRVRYRIWATFKDDTEAHQEFTAIVMPPSTPPREFRAEGQFKVIHSSIGGCCDGGDLRFLTHPRAVFDSDPGEEIDLDGRVIYRLLPSQGLPVIRLNHDGSYETLRVGKAVVEEQFGAAVDDITIIVDPPDY